MKMVSPSALPDYWPPFGQGAAKADVDGNLWVRTTARRADAIGGPIYDVIDRTGKLIDRIQVPPGRQIIGFGKGGTVYMAARDGGNAWLERTHR
jgi:sugar lactone lactonase YvrE